MNLSLEKYGILKQKMCRNPAYIFWDLFTTKLPEQMLALYISVNQGLCWNFTFAMLKLDAVLQVWLEIDHDLA